MTSCNHEVELFIVRHLKIPYSYLVFNSILYEYTSLQDDYKWNEVIIIILLSIM